MQTRNTQCCVCKKPITVIVDEAAGEFAISLLLRVATCPTCMKPENRKRILENARKPGELF